MHCIFKSDFLALGVMLDLISLVACFERFFVPTRELIALNVSSWKCLAIGLRKDPWLFERKSVLVLEGSKVPIFLWRSSATQNAGRKEGGLTRVISDMVRKKHDRSFLHWEILGGSIAPLNPCTSPWRSSTAAWRGICLFPLAARIRAAFFLKLISSVRPSKFEREALALVVGIRLYPSPFGMTVGCLQGQWGRSRA